LKLLISSSSGIPATIRPAGKEATQGVLTVQYLLTPDDKANDDIPAMKEYKAFMKKYLPNENADDQGFLHGYITSSFMIDILKKCGNDLSRENVMKYAQDFPEVPHPLLQPGVKYTTTPTDHSPFHMGVIAKIEGERWVSTGDVVRDNLAPGQ